MLISFPFGCLRKCHRIVAWWKDSCLIDRKDLDLGLILPLLAWWFLNSHLLSLSFSFLTGNIRVGLEEFQHHFSYGDSRLVFWDCTSDHWRPSEGWVSKGPITCGGSQLGVILTAPPPRDIWPRLKTFLIDIPGGGCNQQLASSGQRPVILLSI